MTEDPKRCDLCDATRFAVLARRDRRGEPLETVICEACGLAVHGRTPGAHELTDYYEQRYRREYQNQPRPRRVVRAWRAGQRRFARLKGFLEPEAQVLEVGSGYGCTLAQFTRAGHPGRGVEPDPSCVAFAREELGLEVEVGRLEDITDQTRLDLVLLVHVLEHVRSPRTALEGIASLLKPSGLLYVECPNLAAPFARADKLFHRAHIHNFTPATIVPLAARAGLRLERSFAPERDPTIAMLFQRSAEPIRVVIDPACAARTRAAIAEFGPVGYHLRREYLRLRAVKMWERFQEALFTKQEYQRILSER